MLCHVVVFSFHRMLSSENIRLFVQQNEQMALVSCFMSNTVGLADVRIKESTVIRLDSTCNSLCLCIL